MTSELTDRELLSEAVSVTGWSARKLATHLLARDERTMRRWEAGDSPVPAVVRDHLRRLLALPASRRTALLAILRE